MKRWEDHLTVLSSISNSFDKSSAQYEALEEAAQALLFVNLHRDMKAAYEKFRLETDKEISEEDKQQLRDMGIEP